MRLPLSLVFFLATGVVYLLQLFPFPGILMMFLMAPFWSVPLVNLGFIGVATEAVIGGVSRFWLLLPLAWFGGYAAFAAADHQALRRLQSEVAASNAAVRIPFDPKRHALVFARDGESDWFVTNTTLPVVYARNPNFDGVRHLATRMVDDEVCTKVGADPGLRAAFIHVFGFHDDNAAGIGRRFERRFCKLRQPEDPALPEATVEADRSAMTAGRPSRNEATTTVTMPDGTRHVLRGGFATPLRSFPMPVIGCGPTGVGPRWECGAGFARERSTPLQTGGPRFRSDYFELARALGLDRVAPADRQGADPGVVAASVELAKRRVVEAETAKLERVLADVTANVGDSPFESLREQPDAVVERLDRIVAAIERGLDVKRNGRNNTQQLWHLLWLVPTEALEPYRGRIETLRLKGGWFAPRFKDN